MKIRHCFVSNSSTSSYVILTSKENHEKVLAEMGPSGKLLEFAGLFAATSFMGHKCVIASWTSGNYAFPVPGDAFSTTEAAEHCGYGDEDNIFDEWYNALQEYQDKIIQDKENSFLDRWDDS